MERRELIVTCCKEKEVTIQDKQKSRDREKAWEGKSEQVGDHRIMLLKVCNLGAHSYRHISLRLLQWEVMQTKTADS